MRFERNSFHLHTVGLIGPRTNLRDIAKRKKFFKGGKGEGGSNGTDGRRTALYEIAAEI